MSKPKLSLIFPIVLHTHPAVGSGVPRPRAPLRPVRCGTRLPPVARGAGHSGQFDAWAAWRWTISKCQLMLTPLVGRHCTGARHDADCPRFRGNTRKPLPSAWRKRQSGVHHGSEGCTRAGDALAYSAGMMSSRYRQPIRILALGMRDTPVAKNTFAA